MVTYFEGLREMFRREDLSSVEQLVCVHLLEMNNRRRNVGLVRVTDRELQARTKLSKAAITRAKKGLSEKGIIALTVESRRGGTEYELLWFTRNLGQKLGQKVGQKVGQNIGQNSRMSTYSSISTEEKKYITNNNDDTRTRARESEPSTTTPPEFSQFLADWEKEGSFPTVGKILHQKLWNAYQLHGIDVLKSAMEEAVYRNSGGKNNPYSSRGINPNFFFAQVSRLTEAKTDAKEETPSAENFAQFNLLSESKTDAKEGTPSAENFAQFNLLSESKTDAKEGTPSADNFAQFNLLSESKSDAKETPSKKKPAREIFVPFGLTRHWTKEHYDEFERRGKEAGEAVRAKYLAEIKKWEKERLENGAIGISDAAGLEGKGYGGVSGSVTSPD